MTYLEQRRAFIEAGRPIKTKQRKPIPKVSAKRKEKLKLLANDENSLDKWFEERRKEMTGRCALCNSKTEKDNDETYRRSIHHLFDKRPSMFPSVALHEDNFLEVCFWGNSCHQNIHNRTITWSLLHDSKEWNLIVYKFKKIYPFMAENEKRNLPEILLNEINNIEK